MGLFWKNVLQKQKEWKNSSEGALLLVLKSFFASSGTILENVLTKNGNFYLEIEVCILEFI